jgi:cob(I)alamin adenosyltransferase
MGHRLSRITTRTGDDGTTGVGGRVRVRKSSRRIAAIGAIDELNSALGLLRAQGLPQAESALIEDTQHRLFDLGADLCAPASQLIDEPRVRALETALEMWNADLPPLEEFILPGGNAAAAQCHVARAVCRRAERETWALAEAEAVNPLAMVFLNRLSDLLFVLARRLQRAAGKDESMWKR